MNGLAVGAGIGAYLVFCVIVMLIAGNWEKDGRTPLTAAVTAPATTLTFSWLYHASPVHPAPWIIAAFVFAAISVDTSGTVVDYKHVTKSGRPDRRYKNNVRATWYHDGKAEARWGRAGLSGCVVTPPILVTSFWDCTKGVGSMCDSALGIERVEWVVILTLLTIAFWIWMENRRVRSLPVREGSVVGFNESSVIGPHFSVLPDGEREEIALARWGAKALWDELRTKAREGSIRVEYREETVNGFRWARDVRLK